MRILTIINNCLKPPSTPFSYINTRSVFTESERFQQLLNTIKSIKKYVPTSDIVVCDSSSLDREQMNEICKNANLILFNTDSQVVAKRDGLYKGQNELIMIKRILDSSLINNYDYILKLSGRYEITEKFDINNLNQDKYYLKSFDNVRMSTVLYGAPKKLFSHYSQAINKNINATDSIEYALYPYLKEFKLDTEYLGVKGYVSVSGEYYEA